MQQHNQVMPVLFRERTGNLEPGVVVNNKPSQVHGQCLPIERDALYGVADIQKTKMIGGDEMNMAGKTNEYFKKSSL